MSKKDQALQMLREGKKSKEIREATSHGTLHNALKIFIPEELEKVENLRKEKELLEKQKSESQGENSKLLAQNENIKHETIRAHSDLEEKEKQLQTSTKKLESIEKRIAVYEDRGVTEEAFTILKDATIEDMEKFSERVKNAEAAEKTKKTLSELEKKAENTRSILDSLEEENKKLKDTILSLQVQRDELLRENQGIIDSIELIQGFLREGNQLTELEQVIRAFNIHKIPGDPETTVRRLAEAVSLNRELNKLEQEIKDKRVVYNLLQRELSQIKLVLSNYQTAIKDSITELEEEATTRLTNILDYLEKGVKNSQKVNLENTKAYMEQQLAIIEEATKQNTGELEKKMSQWDSKLNYSAHQLFLKLNAYTDTLEALFEEKEKQSLEEKIYNVGPTLLRYMTDNEALKEANIDHMRLFARIVMEHITYSYPDSKVSGSMEIIDMDSNIKFVNYRVLALSALIYKFYNELSKQS